MLLLATGLLQKPERSHVLSRSEHQKEIERVIYDMVDSEDPGPLILTPERKTYFNRLVKHDPEYDANWPLLGEDLAIEYQMVHMAAVNQVVEARPITEIDTIVGPKQLDNSADHDEAWLLLVDCFESHTRIVKDLAAGALLPECVAPFATALPDAYAFMVSTLGTALQKKVRLEPDWLPPDWMDSAMRIFLRIPFDAEINVAGISAPPAPAQPKDAATKLKIKPVDLQTPAQSVLAVPKVNR